MKPHIILNAAMSLEGKIGRKGEKVRFSNDLDKKRVHELRSNVDAIMVGINTILVDNPKLTAHHAEGGGKNPIRVVLDSKARTPLDANVLDGNAETLIAISKKASSVRIENLKKKGAEIIQTEGENEVDLVELMEKLRERRMKTLLLEGGGTLNKSMISLGLIDEIYITISSMLLGRGINLINGPLEDEVKLKLEGIMQLDDQIVLHYSHGRK